MSRLALVILGLVALLVLAAAPDVITIDDDRLAVHPEMVVEDALGYLRGLVDGEAFTYRERWHVRELSPRILDRMIRSFVYLGAAGLLAVTAGLAAGIWVTARRMDVVREWLTSIGAIPDFILALLLQILVVAVYKWTGFRIAHIASLTLAEPALLLPLATLTVVPAISVMRTVSARAGLAVVEDHTLVARAMGLSRRRIFLTRITPIALGFVRADIPRLAGTMLGNLFIVEYLFNIRGVTTFVFSRGLIGGYQYDLVVNALLMTAVVYAAFSLLLHVYLRLVRGLVVRL